MTIVELYDEKPINNVVGTLAFEPDKVIFVGGYSETVFRERRLPILQKYFVQKNIRTPEVEYKPIRRDSLTSIIQVLEEIYCAHKDSDEECLFHVEVTGGEDLILVALGALCKMHPEIELYQITGTLYTIRRFRIDSDCPPLDIRCANTVKDNLVLHGASIVTADGEEYIPGGFVLDDAAKKELDFLWRVLTEGIGRVEGKSMPNLWNRVTTLMGAFEAADQVIGDLSRVKISKDYYSRVIKAHEDYKIMQEYIYFFVRNGLMDEYEEDDCECLSFKNPFVRMLLTKAGLLLELKTYLICKKLLDPRGGDCKTGVTIDWDGEEDLGAAPHFLYDPMNPGSKIDTTNEIDVMATCGLMPYFISCKNGSFTNEELYKLFSVGERFGKGYGKKILVTTDMQAALGSQANVIRQRAVDMGITIVEDVQKMSEKEFEDAMKEVMALPRVRAHA